MPSTIRDVSKLAGVSISTVSKYINGGKLRTKNVQKIKKAIEELNYQPNLIAQSLKNSRTRTIGVLMPSLSNVFCSIIVSELEKELQKEGYYVILCDCNDNPDSEMQCAEFLLQKQVEGIVSMPFTPYPPFVELCQKKNVPIIFIDQKPELKNCDCILIDNAQAAQTATDHLLRNGHTDIGLICGTPDHFTARERLSGYMKSYQLRGLPVSESNICRCGYFSEAAYTAVCEIMKHPQPPTAILATSYDLTIGSIAAFSDLGLTMGTDISFIGFDSMALSNIIRPKLTTMVQPMEKIGQQAARLLMKRLKGDYTCYPCTEQLHASMILGNSVQTRK